MMALDLPALIALLRDNGLALRSATLSGDTVDGFQCEPNYLDLPGATPSTPLPDDAPDALETYLTSKAKRGTE
jgi:hypothetical protein